MTEALGDEEEVTGAATKIQDSLAQPIVQAKFTHSTQVHGHPFPKVEILEPAVARVAREMTLAQRFELAGINRANQALRIEPKAMSPVENHPSQTTLRAINCLAIPKLPYLLCPSHSSLPFSNLCDRLSGAATPRMQLK